MSQRVNKCKHHLKFLSVCDNKTCKQVIHSSDKDLVKCICECALNILQGNIPISQKEKKSKLQKHKSDLRRLASDKPLTEKKRIIQKGNGFLPMLLGPVLAALGPLLLKK